MQHPTSSLLDRLISRDDQLGETSLVPLEGQMPSPRKTRRQLAKELSILRLQIQRDLLTLLQTRHMAADTDLTAWPLVQRSVLNFGIPDLSGTTASSIDVRELERSLVAAIKHFEPRLYPETLTVSCRVDSDTQTEVQLQIEALFGPAEALESFSMNVSICLSSGQCQSRTQN